MLKSRRIIEPFSHNNFKIFSQCKRKYYYEYIKKLHWPDFVGSFETGLAIHKLLDYQARGLDPEYFISGATDEVVNAWDALKNSDILKYSVIESEWAFSVKIIDSQRWLEGRIDRLVKDQDNNKYIIIDFKTGQEIPDPNKEDWQSLIYLYCISMAKNINPDSMEFWYYKVDVDPEVNKIKYSSELHQDYQQKISATVSDIESTENWSPSEKCVKKYCKYRELCIK